MTRGGEVGGGGRGERESREGMKGSLTKWLSESPPLLRHKGDKEVQSLCSGRCACLDVHVCAWTCVFLHAAVVWNLIGGKYTWWWWWSHIYRGDTFLSYGNHYRKVSHRPGLAVRATYKGIIHVKIFFLLLFPSFLSGLRPLRICPFACSWKLKVIPALIFGLNVQFVSVKMWALIFLWWTFLCEASQTLEHTWGTLMRNGCRHRLKKTITLLFLLFFGTSFISML